MNEDGRRVGERLTQATAGTFRHARCTFDYAGASVGVALSLPGETDAAALVARADAAMYEVKRVRKESLGVIP